MSRGSKGNRKARRAAKKEVSRNNIRKREYKSLPRGPKKKSGSQPIKAL